MGHAHSKAKNRVLVHKGVEFICVPGSRREQVLLDLFQSEDRLANRAPVEPQVVGDLPNGGRILPLTIGAVSGFCIGILVGWGI